MEYMEMKMQQYMEAGEHRANELFEHMALFEKHLRTLPQFNELPLVIETRDYFYYVDQEIEQQWLAYQKRNYLL